MASYRKNGDHWEAQIKRRGVRRSRSFETKAQAVKWATITEAEIMAERLGEVPNKPFSDLLERYSESVSVHKRSKKWEQNRIVYLCTDDLAKVLLPNIQPVDFANWRDRRLREVSAATILRDWNLMNAAINTAIKEWKWLTQNPLQSVSRPAKPNPRTRRISDEEVDRLLLALGYDYDSPPETVTARVGAAMLFAIETAMRIGEICALTQENVFEKHVHLPKTKNGFSRDVPLSKEARRILDQLPPAGNVFNLTTSQADALFRKAKSRALLTDLHLHDTRREALTRLSKKLDVMALAKISGHRDLRILQSVYYAPTISDLADRLD